MDQTFGASSLKNLAMSDTKSFKKPNQYQTF